VQVVVAIAIMAIIVIVTEPVAATATVVLGITGALDEIMAAAITVVVHGSVSILATEFRTQY